MLLDWLKENYQVKVKYKIVEANGEGRVGGRLFTYKFPGTGDNDHQYCERISIRTLFHSY
jgi:hypothetical protein